MQQNSGESQTLGLSARERVSVRIAFEVEVDDLEHFVATLATGWALDAVCRGEELQVLDDGHVIIYAEEVRHVAHQSPNLFGVGVDRVVTDVGFSVRRCQQRGDDAHRGGLARAVGTDEAEEVPLLQFQVDPADGVHVAIFFRQVDSSDHVSDYLFPCTGKTIRHQTRFSSRS